MPASHGRVKLGFRLGHLADERFPDLAPGGRFGPPFSPVCKAVSANGRPRWLATTPPRRWARRRDRRYKRVFGVGPQSPSQCWFSSQAVVSASGPKRLSAGGSAS